MPVNVEIKARVADMDALRERVQALAVGSSQLLRQSDTFFEIPSGRLKLRVIDGQRGELIYYERDDERGPTPSVYLISAVESPDTLARLLSSALGIRGIVRKEREVFVIGRTRVHLDHVDSLGTFLELEVVLESGEDVERGHAEAQEVLDSLLVQPGDLVSGAYIDLVESSTA